MNTIRVLHPWSVPHPKLSQPKIRQTHCTDRERKNACGPEPMFVKVRMPLKAAGLVTCGCQLIGGTRFVVISRAYLALGLPRKLNTFVPPVELPTSNWL